MTRTPFFSVVIPLYNRAAILARTLTSILNQTFSDFEIVIVDDGSSDNPEEAINSLHDPRVRFVVQSNSGGSAARNRGIDLATGRYIAFLDSDDQFLPVHLEKMYEILAHELTGHLAVYSPVIVDRGAGRQFVKPPRPIGKTEDMADYVMRDRGFVQTSGLVVPRELAKSVRYRLGLPFGQDTDFAVRLFRAGCKFQMLDEPTVVWNDIEDPKRVSASRKGARVIDWLEDMKPLISRQAYLGYRGWHVAKGVAPNRPLLATKYYMIAVLNACYGPKLALTVLMQIALPERIYRRCSDLVISLARRTS